MSDRVALDRPWLTLDLGQPMQVLSWALNRPGFVTADRIVWREVRNADLPEDLDVAVWFDEALQARGVADSVAFLTSRDIRRFCTAEAQVGGTHVFCLATVGLSNAERIGQRLPYHAPPAGTINVAVQISTGLTQAAMLEAMSLAVQARTAAIMDAEIRIGPERLPATGTGTDGAAGAGPEGATCFAGLHTALGEAVGRAVYDAVSRGARDWKAEPRPGQ